jgi:hypothetical protein
MIARELDPTERELLVRAAILTQATCDARSWRFGFSGDTVDLYRGSAADIGEESGDGGVGRWAMVGLGAALFNLRVAAAALARGTTTTVFPDPNRPGLLAQVRVWPGPGAEAGLAGLLLHLYRPRPGRCSYADRQIPAAIRLELGRAAAAEGATLTWPDEGQPDGVGRLGDCRYDVVHGVLEDDLYPPLYDDLWTRAALTTSVPAADACAHGWVVVGQALQRVLLVAARHGLSGSASDESDEVHEVHEPDGFDGSVDWPGAFGTPRGPRPDGPAHVGLWLGWVPPIVRTTPRPCADFAADDLCS